MSRQQVRALQVVPTELEVVLQPPHIEDAAVIGVFSAASGNISRAHMVKNSSAPHAKVLAKTESNDIWASVAKYNQIDREVVFGYPLPKSPSGKIFP